jgi:putative ABC transport system substrate-binding protein
MVRCARLEALMRRREFIRLVGGAAAAWPVLAGAQEGGPVRRIGMLNPGALSILRQELQKLGWTEGRNLRIDVRFASLDPEQVAGSARELIELAPDLIFTSGAVATAAVQRQTGTIPLRRSASPSPRHSSPEPTR